MKEWNIPVTYKVNGLATIPAEILEEALEMAHKGHFSDAQFDDIVQYIEDDSIKVAEEEDDIDFIRDTYNEED